MFAMRSISPIPIAGPAARSVRRAALAGVVLAGAMIAAPGPAPASTLDPQSRFLHPIQLAQEQGPEDETPVSADQIKKYIAVYTAMQRDHGLTVDQAASKQGLTVDKFRDIENRIEHNPVAHERVMDALRKANKSNQPSK